MPSTYVNEGYLANILGFIKTVAQATKGAKEGMYNQKSKTVYNMSSIARASKDLTMSFPVLSTDTISPDTAAMLTKAIERNNVSMLQMLIASYHINANNGLEAVKMIHTNMDNSFRAEDLIDAVVGTSDYFSGRLYESVENIGDVKHECTRPPINYTRFLQEAQAEFLNTCNIRYPESSISESSVADYTVTERFNDITVLKEANSAIGSGKNQVSIDDLSDEEKKRFENYLKTSSNLDKDDASRAKALSDFLAYQDRQRDFAHKLSREEIEDRRDAFKARRELFFRQLLDSDVKKANELQPTLMVVPFYYEDSSGTERSQEFIAGVKSRLITCTSSEIIDQLSRFNKQGVNLNNLIRANTKEISFAKEFIGGIEQAKIDAKKDSKLTKTSPIWRMLQARSSKSGVKRLIRTKNSKNAAVAITTLIITAQEAEYVLENYKVDITNPVVAREFMENYNLLCLIIVDEQVEVAKFLYDGDSYFTDYSFTSLDKENNSNDTRKLISLLNKTR